MIPSPYDDWKQAYPPDYDRREDETEDEFTEDKNESEETEDDS